MWWYMPTSPTLRKLRQEVWITKKENPCIHCKPNYRYMSREVIGYREEPPTVVKSNCCLNTYVYSHIQVPLMP